MTDFSFGKQESKSCWNNYTKDLDSMEVMRGNRKHIFTVMEQLQKRNPEVKYRADYVGQHRSF